MWYCLWCIHYQKWGWSWPCVSGKKVITVHLKWLPLCVGQLVYLGEEQFSIQFSLFGVWVYIRVNSSILFSNGFRSCLQQLLHIQIVYNDILCLCYKCYCGCSVIYSYHINQNSYLAICLCSLCLGLSQNCHWWFPVLSFTFLSVPLILYSFLDTLLGAFPGAFPGACPPAWRLFSIVLRSLPIRILYIGKHIIGT